jgi:hypothetical protein
LTDDDRDQKGKWWALLKNQPTANWAFFHFGESAPMPLLTCVDHSEDFVPLSTFTCQPVVADGSFDKDSRRFEIVYHGGYIYQGVWEQFRREHPEDYEWLLPQHRATDPSHPDDLFIEIGTCSPS